jgi:hypothetical protein
LCSRTNVRKLSRRQSIVPGQTRESGTRTSPSTNKKEEISWPFICMLFRAVPPCPEAE